MPRRCVSIVALCLLLVLLIYVPPPDFFQTKSDLTAPLDTESTKTIERVQTCMRQHLHPQLDGESPWLAVYGDSLSRGIFFDTVDALNGSIDADRMHAGHSANYSAGCTLLESRPPMHRRKCGGFIYDWYWESTDASRRGGRHRARNFASAERMRPLTLAANGNDAAPTRASGKRPASSTRLSFRLKTFSWEPAYDDAWLHALRTARRLPDALLLSFGVWDMQYPPDVDAPERGVEAFGRALRTFLDRLDAALALARRAPRRPRLFWLSVTAVSDARLPSWKRPRMSLHLSRQYNALARHELRRHGVQYIDTHTSGAAHPEMSLDGVHYGAPVARHHARIFWDALCGSSDGR